MTEEEYDELVAASKPVPYMIFGSTGPESPHDKAMEVWRKVATRVCCDLNSIQRTDAGDDHDFMAEPTVTNQPK